MTTGTATEQRSKSDDRLPVALGYVRRYPWMKEIEFDILQRRLADVASQHGRTLGTVHIEKQRTEPRAFEALLTELRDLPSPAVIVPSKTHLGRWDLPDSKYVELRQATGAEVIVADGFP